MPSVTVKLTSETEQHLRLQASRRGLTLEAYLGNLAEREASGAGEFPDMLREGVEWLTGRGAEEVRAARERILGASPPPREIPEGKSILDVMERIWPGSETDDEIRDALRRLS